MTENKSNRKTSAPSGFEAPSVIAVIPGSFYLPSPLPFFAVQLGTNPIVKGDGWEHRDALSSSTELCVFWITQSYSYRTEQMTCHLSFSSPRHHSVQASPPTAIPSLIGLKAIDLFKCTHSFFVKLWVVLTT